MLWVILSVPPSILAVLSFSGLLDLCLSPDFPETNSSGELHREILAWQIKHPPFSIISMQNRCMISVEVLTYCKSATTGHLSVRPVSSDSVYSGVSSIH